MRFTVIGHSCLRIDGKWKWSKWWWVRYTKSGSKSSGDGSATVG